MASTEVFWRQAGSGPSVICLHSNASFSGQWKALMAKLSDRFAVFAPDSYGAGRSPEWQSERQLTLADEVELIAPIIEKAGEHFSLVGHSYGAAVALKVAIDMPQRVASVAIYEPTLFSLIEADGPPPNEADGIRKTAEASLHELAMGNRDAAAAIFIDYWMGPDSWKNMPDDRKPAISESISNLQNWGHALHAEPTPLSAFAELGAPVLCMTGAQSTASAHGVARRLISMLPHVEHIEFPRLGHMGPITHPDVVNVAIDDFLSRTPGKPEKT